MPDRAPQFESRPDRRFSFTQQHVNRLIEPVEIDWFG
jgi:hypothetical protein